MTAYAVRYPQDGCAVFCLSADEHRALCGDASDKAGKKILRKVPGWFVWAKPSRALGQHRTIEVSPKQKTSTHKRSDAFQNLLARQTSIKPPDRVCQLKSSLPKQTYYSFLRFAFAALGIASFESEAAA